MVISNQAQGSTGIPVAQEFTLPYTRLNLFNILAGQEKTFGMLAIHNWVLTEVNRQKKVSVEESIEGFFAKLLKKTFNKNPEKGMERWLNVLKKECEK